MPRKRDAAQQSARRDAIIDAMMHMIGQHGYERTSIQMIATSAGLSSGLIHYYFDTKQAILLAVMQTLKARMHARFERALKDASSQGDASVPAPLYRVIAWIRAHLSRDVGVDGASLSTWLALTAQAVHVAPVREAYTELVREDLSHLVSAIAEVYTQSEPDPEVRRLRATAHASTLYACVQGYYSLSQTTEGIVPEGVATQRVEQLARALILPSIRS